MEYFLTTRKINRKEFVKTGTRKTKKHAFFIERLQYLIIDNSQM